MYYLTTISHAVNADGKRVNIRTPGFVTANVSCANTAAARCN